MGAEPFWEGITIGASGGLIAGLVLGLLSLLKNLVQRWWERREQIRHLASVIEECRRLIYQPDDPDDFDLRNDPVGQVDARNAARKAYLIYLWEQTQVILLNRSDRLSFDEIQQVRKAFWRLERFPQLAADDQNCDNIFYQLETIEWLKLAKSLS